MDIRKVIAALDSDMRIEILKILADSPKTVSEVLSNLHKRDIEVKYRETVYRALEKLVDAELVEKYYDKEKGLCYKILMNRITIDLTKGAVVE